MKIDIVICRFAEPWEDVQWLCNTFITGLARVHDIQFYIYNKGEPYEGTSAHERIKIIPQENIGREQYTYLHHIYQHYNDLADVTVCVMASCRYHKEKNTMVYHIIQNLEHQHLVCFRFGQTFQDVYNLTIDALHTGTNTSNAEICKTQTFTQSTIRPFGAWYDKTIPVAFKNITSLFGMVSVHKHRLKQYSENQYKIWYEEIEALGANSEIAHYWERVWYSLYG